MPTKEVETPVKTPVKPEESPDKFYQPERLCPNQRKDGTWRSLP